MFYDKKEIFDIIRDPNLSNTEKAKLLHDIRVKVSSLGGGIGKTKMSGLGGEGTNQGDDQGQGDNQGKGQGDDQGQGQGKGQGDDQGQGQGDNQGKGQGNDQGQGQGQGNDQGQGQGNNQGKGQGNDQGQGQGNNQGKGQGNDQGQGQGQGNDQGQGQGNNQGKGQGNDQGQGQGNDQGKGQGDNQGQGQGNDQGQGQGDDQGQGQGQGGDVDLDQDIDDSDDNSGTPMSLDDYQQGYIMGRKYAKDMYRMKGLRPGLHKILELPTVEKMTIKESLNESSTGYSDILSILDDANLTNDEKSNIIQQIFISGDKETEVGKQEDKPEIDLPDDAIIARNGVVDRDNLMTGEHVISRELGDQIRKELGVKPKDPDWGLGDDPEILETYKILQSIWDDAHDHHENDEETEKRQQEQKSRIKGRMKRNRDGIIDWKRAVQSFMNTSTKSYKKGPMRMAMYKRTHILANHRIPEKNSVGKAVVYVDTSGSVNNSSTQLIPLMAGEIAKLTREARLKCADIHLFDSTVYSEHYGVLSSTVKNADWGIDAYEGGGTDIHQVYNHIRDNYVSNGHLLKDVACIIIITDISGLTYGNTSIAPYLKYFSDSVLKRMMYLVYLDEKKMHSDGTEFSLKDYGKKIDTVVSKYSKHYEITLNQFKKQLMNGVNYTIQEALDLGNVRKRSSMGQARVRAEIKDDEQIKIANRVSAIQGARDANDISIALPELGRDLKLYFPQCSMASKDAVCDKERKNLYYVNDNGQVIININLDKNNIDNFIEATDKIPITAIIGDVIIVSSDTFIGFPVTFPKVVDGNFRLFRLRNMASLDNMPTTISGRIMIDPLSRNIKKEQIDKYMRIIDKDVYSILSLTESLQRTVDERINTGVKYILEAFGPKEMNDLFIRHEGRRSKGIQGRSVDSNGNVIKVATKSIPHKTMRLNSDVQDLLKSMYNIDWNNIGDDCVELFPGNEVNNILKQTENRHIVNNGAYLKASEIKKIKDAGTSYIDNGLRFFIDSDDNIKMVAEIYTKNSEVSFRPVIVRIDGNYVTDKNEINKFVKERKKKWKEISTIDLLDSFGFEVASFKSKETDAKSESGSEPDIRYNLLKILIHACEYTKAPDNFKKNGKFIPAYRYVKSHADLVFNKEYLNGILGVNSEKILTELYNNPSCVVQKGKKDTVFDVVDIDTNRVVDGLSFVSTRYAETFNKFRNCDELSKFFTVEFMKYVLKFIPDYDNEIVDLLSDDDVKNLLDLALDIKQRKTLLALVGSVDQKQATDIGNDLTMVTSLIFPDDCYKLLDVGVPIKISTARRESIQLNRFRKANRGNTAEDSASDELTELLNYSENINKFRQNVIDRIKYIDSVGSDDIRHANDKMKEFYALCVSIEKGIQRGEISQWKEYIDDISLSISNILDYGMYAFVDDIDKLVQNNEIPVKDQTKANNIFKTLKSVLDTENKKLGNIYKKLTGKTPNTFIDVNDRKENNMVYRIEKTIKDFSSYSVELVDTIAMFSDNIDPFVDNWDYDDKNDYNTLYRALDSIKSFSDKLSSMSLSGVDRTKIKDFKPYLNVLSDYRTTTEKMLKRMRIINNYVTSNPQPNEQYIKDFVLDGDKSIYSYATTVYNNIRNVKNRIIQTIQTLTA